MPLIDLGEWASPGLSDLRDAINSVPAAEAPLKCSLEPGPCLQSILKGVQLSQDQQEILNLSGADIVRKIKERKLSASQVIEAFLPITAWAHQVTGCLSDFFPHEARRRASELDAKQARGEELGALHGLPISIKGHILMAGHRSQNGFAFDELDKDQAEARLRDSAGKHPQDTLDLIRKRSAIANPSDEDGLMCHILREQGAVFYCRTTMPQSVMQLDTRSSTYGQTLNPHNLALSAGGSSGGEAALVAAKGSVIGVGTDIGGSVRQPCAVTGLWGLRATCGRIPTSSVIPPTLGNSLIASMTGPMCRFREDVSLWMQAVLAGQPWLHDPNTYRIPWRLEVKLPGRLRIGVLHHDGVVRPITPIRRGMQHVLERLREHVDLVEVNVRDLSAASWDLIRELYYPDGGAFTRALADLGQEPLLPLTEHIVSGPVRNRSQHEMWDLVSRRDALKKQYLKWWQAQKIDFLLCPACATVAPRPGTIKYWGYTSAFNFFDVPGAVFPTGLTADATKDADFEVAETASFKSASKWDQENEDEYVNHRQVFDGAPIGLQIVGQRFEEEEVVAALEMITKHL